LKRFDLNWPVLIVSVADSNLAFGVVTGSPHLPVDQENGMVLSAGDHLYVFVSETFELGRRGYSVEVPDGF
jgi:hypothetical protein